MECKIFYSWQSDLPNSTNRSFIEKALENAIKAIRDDESIKLEPVIDRDTSGQPGSPDIAKTILGKIEKSQIFICDVSITNNNIDGRKTPNPNVLYELGFAHKALGEDRIINVLNTFYGKPEDLPFDIRMRRAVTYNLQIENTDKQTIRKGLESSLENHIKIIIHRMESEVDITATSDLVKALNAINENSILQERLIKKYLEWFVSEIQKIAPNFSNNKIRDESLLESINRSTDLIKGFYELIELIIDTNSKENIVIVLNGLEPLLDNYYTPMNFSGYIDLESFDYFRFIGHEIFVSIVAIALKDKKWDLIKIIIDNPFELSNKNIQHGIVNFAYFSQDTYLFEARNKRLQLHHKSLYAILLKERHSETNPLGSVKIEDFVDSELFLSLISKDEWVLKSGILLGRRTPNFLLKAISHSEAKKLSEILGCKNIQELQDHLKNWGNKLQQYFIQNSMIFHIQFLNIDFIGTE